MSINTKWTLVPPHGMSFKNELGSEVSIEFPENMTTDLYHSLMAQINTLYQAYITKEASKPKPVLNAGLTLDDDGNLVHVKQ